VLNINARAISSLFLPTKKSLRFTFSVICISFTGKNRFISSLKIIGSVGFPHCPAIKHLTVG